MGITMFTFGRLASAVQALAGWLVQAPRQDRARFAARPAAAHANSARVCARRPLRVVRVLDAACHASSGAGRMVISGRMADVCAELDRLAELEAMAG